MRRVQRDSDATRHHAAIMPPSDTCLSHPHNRHSHRPSRSGAVVVGVRLSSYMSAAAVVCAATEASSLPAASIASTIYVKALAAAQRNDTKALTEIWEKHGSKIFTEPLPEESGFILHYAAKGLRVKSVIWLLEHGADVNAIDREGETPFCWCATIASFSARTKELLQLLVNAGADPNWQDFNGYTPLTHAVVRGSVDATRRARVQALLELGADPRMRDYDGKQPVDYLGMNTNDGWVWTAALPENQREMQRCRALLKDEMFRREVRVVLMVVRARGQQESRRRLNVTIEQQQGKEEEKEGGGERREQRRRGGCSSRAAVEEEKVEVEEEGGNEEGVEVVRRLMGLQDDVMFMRCVNFI